MSHDRVRFTIPAMRLTTSSEASIYRVLVRDVFGQEISPDDMTREITIICRPSQFARFLIERNNRGLQNQFAELRPALFIPENVSPKIVDVSRNGFNGANINYAKDKLRDY